MSLHILDIFSKPSDKDIVKSDIENKLSTGKICIIKHYKNKPDDDILNNEKSIVIETEYPNISNMLYKLKEQHPNFNYDIYDEKMEYSHWFIISEVD